MNMVVREKRKITFSSKVVTPAIIKRIAAVFEREASVISESDSLLLIYSIDAFDDSSYESQSTAIFELEGVFSNKAFQRIRLQFQTTISKKNIEVQLYHTADEDKANNFIIVGGEDSIWVNGILSQLSEIINSAHSQPKVKDVILIFDWVVIVLFNVLYFKLFGSTFEKIKSEWLTLALVVCVPIGSIYLGGILKEYLVSLWPNIELQLGNDHSGTVESKRKRTISIAVLIILPILLGFIYDGLKNALHLF